MVCPLYRGCPLLRGSNRIILIGRDKFGDLVSSIVERYLIQCPFLGGSSLRGSTVVPHDHLEHTIIDSRNPSNFRVLQNLYVALFRPGSISTTEADTLDFRIFPSSSAAFPSLLYLVNVQLLSGGTSTESPATSPLPMDNLTTFSMLLGNLTTYLTPTKLATHEKVTSEAPVVNSTNFVIVFSTMFAFLFIISSLIILFSCCCFFKSNSLRCHQSDNPNHHSVIEIQ